MRMSRGLRNCWLLVATLCMAGSWAAFAADPSEDSEALKSTKVCMECHDGHPFSAVFRGAHGALRDERSPLANGGCIACHGPSTEHARQKSNPPDITFGRDKQTPVEEQNRVCQGCHSGGMQMHWEGSPHAFGDVGCASCHNLHADHDAVLARSTQSEICLDCHVEKRAQILLPSSHPIREGLVSCSDCHNPHGSLSRAQLNRFTVNDTCYACHAEKRGPFLWEHQPVREDCTICHTPHGSTQQALLKERGPWLCQNCHSAAFHPSTLYDGRGIPPNGFDSHLLLRNCMNCHPKVHGSNHPAGVRFTR